MGADVLHAGAIAVTHGWPLGEREVENVLGVSICLRAFSDLHARADLMPIPNRGVRTLEGRLSTSHGRMVETFDGAAFSHAILEAVRDAWPGVAWVVGSPYGLRGRDGRAAYGFVGRRCVAVIAQMVDEPSEDAAS